MIALIRNIFDSRKHPYGWVYFFSMIFIALNAILIYKEFYYFTIIPIALFLVYLAFSAYDKFLLLIVFLSPLSVPLREINRNLPVDLYLPTEILIAGLMILFLLKQALKNDYDRHIGYHPISIAIFVNLIWIFITCITSNMPLVSFKFLLARLWFVIVFYFVAAQIFKNLNTIKRYAWLYIIPLLIVIVYTISRHLGYGLTNQEAAHWVPNPFYKDHTSYGATLAMILPVIFGFIFLYKGLLKNILFVLLFMFTVALILSYTRAAWLSLVGAVGVLAIILLRINFKLILGVFVLSLIFLYSFRSEILIQLEQNRQDSSENLAEHVKSMSNIATDASNLERLNRWSSALRMFREKPIFGWGPGTYMFQYAPYQKSFEKTIISTNAGDMGNAHSEYIGSLSESGVIGSLSFILIVVLTIFTAIKIYRRSKVREVKIISLSLLISLVTYYLHGFLNNFLDTDKASALFWGFTAAIVALDVYHTREQKRVA